MVGTDPSQEELASKRVVSAGIIIFRKTRDGLKFLLMYQGRGYWNFPKGKIEKEERSWQTALREVQEETGLKESELKLVGNFKTFERFFYRRGREKIFKVVILYLAQTEQKQVQVLSREHSGYGWFQPAEAKKMLAKHPDSVKIVQKAYNFLRNRGVAGAGSGKKRVAQREE